MIRKENKHQFDLYKCYINTVNVYFVLIPTLGSTVGPPHQVFP